MPTATFKRVDLLDEWPGKMLGRSFDRVVSSYVLHEFGDETKIELIVRLAQVSLAPGGMVPIGDIMFPDTASRSAAHEEWRNMWDEEEHYAAANELIPALQSQGHIVSFENLSFCAGVLTVKY